MHRPLKDTVLFVVANLGNAGAFLGFDWLECLNPVIDWKWCCANFSNNLMTDTSILEKGDKVLWVDPEACAISLETRRTSESSPLTQIPGHLHKFANIFLKNGFDELPPHHEWNYAIELVSGAKLHDCKVYLLSPGQQCELDMFIKENLISYQIRLLKSPLASLFFFIQKKDGSLCSIQNYHYLNFITIKNKYPLSLISDLINKLKNVTTFTKFNVWWGYNNICIHSGDEWKVAFKTNCGIFEPLVMFFRLTNSPATFQAIMNKIFAEEIWERHIVIFLDEILIFSNNLDEHCALVAWVLQKLWLYKLYLKSEKCEFEQESVGYLGMVVSEGEVWMEEKKVEAIRSWSTPSKKKDLQQFLGFINFYHKFIQELL